MSFMPHFYHSPQFSEKSTEERFKLLLESYANQANALGINLKPHTPETFKRFRSFDAKKQEEILKNFQAYYEVYASAISNEVNIDDNHSLIWWVLKKLNLRPPSDLFSHLAPGDVVEIYTPQFIQVFRSFNFFRLCGYSLDQILTYEWPELYSRDEVASQEMMKLAFAIVNGNAKQVVMSQIPPHPVEQRLIPPPNKIKMIHKLAAPLYGPNNEVYLFSVFRAEEYAN